MVTASRIVAPRDPRAMEGIDAYGTYLGPTPGYVEQAYWHDLLADADGRTLAMLRNRAGDRGVVMRFNRNELPAFSQWKNTASISDGYVTGLEPGTDYPNTKAFERKRGRVVQMAPGETYRAELTMEIHDSATGVSAIEAEAAALQEQEARTVYREPIPKYSDME